jgi:ribokinase
MAGEPRATVVVVGSLHYDIMVDAPYRPRTGETVSGYRWRPKFGGKGGNQAVAAASAGAGVRIAGAVGDDDFAAFLMRALADAGVDTRFVQRKAGTGSGMSVAISDAEGDYAAVIVSGANLGIDPAALDDPDLWRGAQALVLQNEVPDAVNLAAASAARARGVRVILNAAPFRVLPEHLVALIDVLVVNAVEAQQFCGIEVSGLPAAVSAAERLAKEFPVAVVTAGGDGVAAAERGARSHMLAAIPVTLVSTHGAGDAFVGQLAVELAAGCTISDALRLANEAAARHVSKRL